MAERQGPGTNKLIGWLKQAVQSAMPPAPPEEPPASPPAEAPARRAGETGPLSPSGRLSRPGTDQFQRVSAPPASPGPITGQLRQPSQPQPPTSASVPSAEQQEAESEKRMAFIVDYLDDPEGDEMFRDKQLVYKIVAEERTYQQQLVGRLSQQLRGLEPDTDAYEDATDRIEKAKRRQSQLFGLLKQLTGVRGKTGGTGFLDGAQAPPPMPFEPESR